jgi:hypothetical protein
VDNPEAIRQSLQNGMARVGFIRLQDTPTGIKFGLELDESFSETGPAAKRFIANAHEWITKRSIEICVQKGVAPPVVHNFEPSETSARIQVERKVGMAVCTGGLILFVFLVIYQAWWAAIATSAIAFLLYRQASKRMTY